MKSDTEPSDPHRPLPRTCLADVRELRGGGRSGFADAVREAGSRLEAEPRKRWEWDAIAATLGALGVDGPDAELVGLGVGDEALMFHLARRCRSVVGVDRYAADNAWREARYSDAEAVAAAAPFDYPADRLRVLDADMRAVPRPDASADAVWSCSSVEHVPDPAELLAVFHEAQRLLRPGGVLVVTTEFSLHDTPYLLPGVLAWDRRTLAWADAALPGLERLGPTDLGYDASCMGHVPTPRRREAALRRGRVIGDVDAAPQGVARLAGISVVVPILLAWRKVSDERRAWEDSGPAAEVRRYTEALRHHRAQRDREAAALLGPMFGTLGQDGATRQWALHAGRLLLECEARGGLVSEAGLRSRIAALRELSGDGPVVDADCLDLCGYLLGELGDPAGADAVDLACLSSPSTTAEHVMQLAARVVVRHEGRGEAAARARAEVEALRGHGLTGAELRAGFFDRVARAGVSMPGP